MNARPQEDLKKLITWCDKRLLAAYGDKPHKTRPDPLKTLILTLLSQNTNDGNRDLAFSRLTARFPAPEDMLRAPLPALEAAIRPGGLSRQKARRLKAMLKEIKRREGSLELKRLCRMEKEEALSYLMSFKGVGKKTSAIVLLFSCGIPVFPVDTHILRISKRLELIPETATAEKAHDLLDPMVPDSIKYRFHLNLIQHGRTVCRARKPQCRECCLKPKCPSAGRWN